MLRTIAVIAQEPVAMFELGVLCEVFGVDRTDDGVPAFDFRVCSARPGEALHPTSGRSPWAPLPLGSSRGVGLVAAPGGPVDGPYDPDVLDVLRDNASAGHRVLSV